MWAKTGYPAKITKLSAKSLLSLGMGESNKDEADYTCFHLIPFFFIDYNKKKSNLI